MCSPAPTPSDAIGLYWTDENIILFLDKVRNGSALPNYVSEDIDPYQYSPSNLPPEIWYLVRRPELKETEHGFWKAKGEACEIYQDPAIYGWRTTLEFFEGPDGRKTDWVMQEYKITQKGGHKEKNLKHSAALCTVFHCCGGRPDNDMKLEQKLADSGRKSVAKSNSTSGVRSTSESQAKSKDASDDYLIECTLGENYIELNDLAEDIRQSPADDPRSEALVDQLVKQDFLELDDLTEPKKAEVSRSEPRIDRIPIDDFLKLDDLEDPDNYLEVNDLDGIVSHSSSSGNSSHRSLASDDDFFSIVRNMDDENNANRRGKDSSHKCRINGPAKPDEVIMHPATLGSLVKGTGNAAAIEALPASATEGDMAIKPSKTQLLGDRCESRETKAHPALPPAAKKNKFKKYLCFLSF